MSICNNDVASTLNGLPKNWSTFKQIQKNKIKLHIISKLEVF